MLVTQTLVSNQPVVKPALEIHVHPNRPRRVLYTQTILKLPQKVDGIMYNPRPRKLLNRDLSNFESQSDKLKQLRIMLILLPIFIFSLKNLSVQSSQSLLHKTNQHFFVHLTWIFFQPANES